MEGARSRVVAVLVSVLLSGCSTTPGVDPGVTAGTGGAGPAEAVAAAPIDDELTGAGSGDPVASGKRNFRAGRYALAEQDFRKAVETGPRDVEAWIGLGASYDRLNRFDLADRAYAQAVRIGGETAVILNNQGYSQLLRGNVKAARAKFLAAKRRDPDNPTVDANLELLEASVRLGKDVQ
jgi:Flp pilus assembly protein TadD